MSTEKRELLPPEALRFICQALGAKEQEIVDLVPTKSGMTNRSFHFSQGEKTYILRVPGAGTDQLINRKQEAANYKAMQGSGIPDHVLAFDPETGYKLTEFWPQTRNCDPQNPEEVRRCMEFLRSFHGSGRTVAHRFDLFGQIQFYEDLMGGVSQYSDYETVKQRCLAMKPFLFGLETSEVLTHVDAVPDNFLFVTENGQETIHLIDWEYAGMFDPHLDIAMFAIYAGYDRQGLHQLMDWYFPQGYNRETRLKIYCYTALGGLLWSNWCEYKRALGVDFGDYATMQYGYARDYSRLFFEEREGEHHG